MKGSSTEMFLVAVSFIKVTEDAVSADRALQVLPDICDYSAGGFHF
jgi:hypothetical protein